MLVHQSPSEKFIGRKQEIITFIDWLDHFDIPDTPTILYFFDALEEKEKKGGIGKTKLLHECLSFIRSERRESIIPISVDFFNIADRDSIVIAERIIEALEERYPDRPAVSFKEALNRYRHVIQIGGVDASTLRDQIGNALSTDLQSLYELLIQNDNYLLLFLDTFEVIEENPNITLLRPHQHFPDTYGSDRIRYVIAGRNALNMSRPNWVKRQSEIRSVKLSPFSYEETIEYLRANCDTCNLDNLPSQKLQKLYNYTEGRPILIGLVADILDSEEKLDELIASPKSGFEAMLVEQITSLLDRPKRAWGILFMAHIYHRFNAELLYLILSNPALQKYVPEMTFNDLEEELPKLSFVRRADKGEDFVLHDEMRRLVNSHSWSKIDDSKHSKRHELSKMAIDYYTQKIAQEQNGQKRQSYIQSYSVERLFHQLFNDKDEGFKLFEEHFSRAIELWMKGFARSLLQEAQKFGDSLSSSQRNRLKLAEVKLLHAEENPEAALKLCLQLEADTEQFELHRIEILYEKGECYQSLRKFSDAIAAFEACLGKAELKDNEVLYASILRELGYTYRLQGNWNEAVHYYKESITVQRNLDDAPGYAEILNNLGNVYRLQGMIEDALMMCKIALRIREELFRADKLSELDVGLSLSTLGQVYLERHDITRDKKDIRRAEDCFQRALKIYERMEYKRGIAATFLRIGQVQLAKENWEEAKKFFEEAYEASVGTNAEARITSLNRQGHVMAAQEKWKEAIPYFSQAIALAKKEEDFRQYAESLIDFAEAHERIGQPQHKELSEAKQISRTYNYHNLLARIEDMQGDTHYIAKEYRAAFKHFGAACRYMALYSSPRYEIYLRKLLDLFLDTPTPYLPEAIDILTYYWLDYKLEQNYPELLKICRGVSKHLVL